MIFHFSIIQVHFFLLIEFHCIFAISYKIVPSNVYYYLILIRQWVIGRRDYFLFHARFTSFHTHSVLSCLLHLFHSSHFILTVPIPECLGKHWCMSFPFPIAVLSGTSFFPPVQLKVYIFEIWCEKVRANKPMLLLL